MHGERVGLDGDAEHAAAGVGRGNRAAVLAGQRGELAALAFPHDLAAPAQLPADISRRQADHLVPRHGEVPALQAHPEAAVAVGAMDVRRGGVPVVAALVDEAEPQPDGIREIEGARRARQIGPVEYPVGGKSEGARGMIALPATGRTRLAAHGRRIERVEFARHALIDRRRQGALQDAARRVGQKQIMAFVDARGGEQPLAGRRGDDDGDGGKPGLCARAHRAGKDNDRHDQQQRIGAEMIDRQADRRDRQQ